MQLFTQKYITSRQRGVHPPYPPPPKPATVHAIACMCGCIGTHNLLPAGEDGDHALELLDVVLHVNTMEGQVAPLLVTRVLQHSRHTRVGWEIGGQ